MPELGHISREEAAALAGLATFDDDSGTHKGHKRSGAPAALFIRRGAPGRLSMEQSFDRPLRSPYRTRKSPQRRSCRLRQKAVDLRQYRHRARNPMDPKSRRDLMVATTSPEQLSAMRVGSLS